MRIKGRVFTFDKNFENVKSKDLTLTLMKKRVQVYYRGYVQGVGFRFTAEYIARNLKLTGWVKNTSDGGVEVVCEGEESVIKDFLGQLENRMKRYITDKDIDWETYKGEFKDFDIRFY